MVTCQWLWSKSLKGNESLIRHTDLSNLVIPNLTAQLAVASQAVIAETVQTAGGCRTLLCAWLLRAFSPHTTTSPCLGLLLFNTWIQSFRGVSENLKTSCSLCTVHKVMLTAQELLGHRLQACWSSGRPFGFLLVVWSSLLDPRGRVCEAISEDPHFSQCTGTSQKAFIGRCGRGQRFAPVRGVRSRRNFLNLTPRSAGLLLICWMPNTCPLLLERSSNTRALY